MASPATAALNCARQVTVPPGWTVEVTTSGSPSAASKGVEVPAMYPSMRPRLVNHADDENSRTFSPASAVLVPLLTVPVTTIVLPGRAYRGEMESKAMETAPPELACARGGGRALGAASAAMTAAAATRSQLRRDQR